MPAKSYKCNNTNCDNGLMNTTFVIEPSADEVCPECKEKAVPAKGKEPPLRLALVGIAVAAAAIAGGGFAFWPSGPHPEQAQAMLSEFFPGLPK